jgi:hypothetical protein
MWLNKIATSRYRKLSSLKNSVLEFGGTNEVQIESEMIFLIHEFKFR